MQFHVATGAIRKLNFFLPRSWILRSPWARRSGNQNCTISAPVFALSRKPPVDYQALARKIAPGQVVPLTFLPPATNLPTNLSRTMARVRSHETPDFIALARCHGSRRGWPSIKFPVQVSRPIRTDPSLSEPIRTDPNQNIF